MNDKKNAGRKSREEKSTEPMRDGNVYRCPNCFGEGVIGEEWAIGCPYCDARGGVSKNAVDNYSDWLAQG